MNQSDLKLTGGSTTPSENTYGTFPMPAAAIMPTEAGFPNSPIETDLETIIHEPAVVREIKTENFSMSEGIADAPEEETAAEEAVEEEAGSEEAEEETNEEEISNSADDEDNSEEQESDQDEESAEMDAGEPASSGEGDQEGTEEEEE